MGRRSVAAQGGALSRTTVFAKWHQCRPSNLPMSKWQFDRFSCFYSHLLHAARSDSTSHDAVCLCVCGIFFLQIYKNPRWRMAAILKIVKCDISAPLVQTGQHKQFSLFDLDLWPTTFTYNPRLAKVKVNPHGKIKVKDQTVQTGECPETNDAIRLQ